MNPVLPWGRSETTTVANNAIDRDLPKTKNFIFGQTRIEVYWKIESDDAENDLTQTVVTWWPATLERRIDDTTDGEGRTAYVIKYDPNATLGYPDATENRVTFLHDHELYDLDYDEILQWRLEGDTSWNPPESNSDEDVLVSAKEMEQEEERISRLRGVSSEDAFARNVNEVISDLPADRQRHIASSIQSGLQIFTEEIQASLAGKSGDEKIVTLADMESAIERIKNRMQQGR